MFVPAMRFDEYLEQSRRLFNSLVLISPVFVLYQLGIIVQLARSPHGGFSLNGADYLTQSVLHLLGNSLGLYVLFVVLVASGFGVALYHLSRRQQLNRAVFVPVLAESTLYALLLGSTIHLVMGLPSLLASVGVLSAGAAPWGFGMKVFHALGAGFNEELLFRLGLLGGSVGVGSWLRVPKRPLLIAAFLLSALTFSAFHYIGPYADAFLFDSFMFRFLAGLLLAAIYWWRGLATAVYTHAIYDLYFFLIIGVGA